MFLLNPIVKYQVILLPHMRLLRDKKTLTKFLLLYRTATEEPTRLAELASALDMSEQAVSNYVSEMEDEGLIDTGGKRYKPSPKGVEFVGEVLSQLGSFLEDASREIDFISKCTAIADEKIEKGDEVGLFMSEGFLRATHGSTGSVGIALNDAEEGAPLVVGKLRGMTEMDVGCVYLIATQGKGDPKGSVGSLERILEDIDYDLLAVENEWNLGLANIMGLKVDIRFAPVQATLMAAEKGLDVAFLLTDRTLDNVISSIDARNRGRPDEYRISYRVL